MQPARNPGRYPPSTTLGVEVTSAIDGASGPALPVGEESALTGTFMNQGVGTLRAVALSAQVPQGWTLAAEGDTSVESLGTGESFGPRWAVGVAADALPGTYDLTVTATYEWGRSRTHATVTSTVTALVLAPPPGGEVALSSLEWASATNGWGPVERDTSNGEQAAGDGGPITIGGQVYERGLGAHAPGEILYYLGGRCSSFTTDVGLDDEKTANGSASFIIQANNEVVAQSGTLTVADPAMTLTADVTGATWLRLVTDPGPTTDSDHTDWAEPTITCETR